MFEKSVTLIGNIVAIITFVLSVLNWFGLSTVLDASIPNRRVASAVLIGYGGMASYAAARTLLAASMAGKSVALLWFALAFSYAFGFLFLLDKSKVLLAPDPLLESNIIGLAGACYGFALGLLWVWPKMFPDGYSFTSHFSRPLVSAANGLLFLANFIVIFMLLSLLH